MSSEKIQSRERITTLFAAEIRLHLFVFALISVFAEIYFLAKEENADDYRDVLSLAVIGFFFLFSILEYVFRLFASSRASALALLLPATLLSFLLKDIDSLPYMEVPVIIAVLIRLFLAFLPNKDVLTDWGSFILAAISVYLCLEWNAVSGELITDKLLFVCLSVLVLAALQKLLRDRSGAAFPFYYFALIAVLVFALPMGDEPIDWSKAIAVGERLVSGVRDVADNASYYLSFMFQDGSYSAGYSSFNVNGERVSKSDKTQLILRTSEKPYFVFKDDETGANMKMLRNIYLSGGKGVEYESLVSLLNFMHEQGVDKEQASLFSQISKVNIEYVYLDTADEIVPNNSIMLSSGGKRVDGGVSKSKHKKGYVIDASFLDIDYCSPYFEDLIEQAQGKDNALMMSYSEADSYMWELYGIELSRVIREQDYEEFLETEPRNIVAYTDTSGATNRMMELSKELTSGINSNYEKCRIIERYLRQYPYSTDSVGGHNPDSDMSTAQGMADIADRFLFETEKGYCVHYTSSMVMLLRLAGIPARVAVGYRYAYPFEQQDSYIVGSDCAHAWPEAYFENIGWVPFEPTSAYMTATDFTWHRKAKEADTVIEKPVSKEQEYIPEIPEVEETEPEEEDNTQTTTQVLSVVIIVSLSVVLLIVLLILGTIAIRSLRYRHGTPEKKLAMDVESIKKLLRQQYTGDFIERGLLSDYVEIAPPEYQNLVKAVFDVYYRSIYGNGDNVMVSQDENGMARALREELQKGRRLKLAILP